MTNPEYIKSLPRVEISFQDDFAGDERELTLTPQYVLRKLSEQGSKVQIGDKILLWEKDYDDDNKEYCLANVGEIVGANQETIEDAALVDNKPVIIKIDRESYLRLSSDFTVLK